MKKILLNFNISLLLAFITILIVNAANPSMGFLEGTPFTVLVVSLFWVTLDDILIHIKEKRSK